MIKKKIKIGHKHFCLQLEVIIYFSSSLFSRKSSIAEKNNGTVKKNRPTNTRKLSGSTTNETAEWWGRVCNLPSRYGSEPPYVSFHHNHYYYYCCSLFNNILNSFLSVVIWTFNLSLKKRSGSWMGIYSGRHFGNCPNQCPMTVLSYW